jgi:RNA polymerase sigma-70 factor (sigma-E family)
MVEPVPRFEVFVEEHLNGLLRTAFLIAWDEREAEDLVQETLFRVARNWRRVAAMEHPFAYARRILVRLAVADAPKRYRRRTELATTESVAAAALEIAAAGTELAALEIRAELIAALGRLNPRQRAVIVLRYFFDLSEAETAEAVGCSLGTVKSNASRGLEQLRQILEPGDVTSASDTGSLKPRSVEL